MNNRSNAQLSAIADTQAASATATLEATPRNRPSIQAPKRDRAPSASLPVSRGARLLSMGRLAGGLTGGAVAEGLRRLVAGRPLSKRDLLLTPANAARMANRLAELRGAAMKVGQLLSMEAGELLPQEFTLLLEKLRDDARTMPLGQVASVLNSAWGDGWDKGFRRFVFTPMAAASIGQVHEAETAEGRRVAVKIQYPHVRESIDSDVENVATLLRVLRLMPPEVDIEPLLVETKAQLHREADYLSEAAHIRSYGRYLGEDPGFTLPEVIDELTNGQVLTMSLIPGPPVDRLEDAPACLRDDVSRRLMALAFRECFDWGLVQTDPNFANYRYDERSGRIGLLDFGATRRYEAERISVLKRLLCAAVRKDRGTLEHTALEAGYLDADAPYPYRDTVTGLLMDVTEPARAAGAYDFADTDLATRMGEKVFSLRVEQRYWHLPPVEMLLLHRKLGGLYLTASRLRARVDVRSLVEPYLS